jgi:hypothetical protein
LESVVVVRKKILRPSKKIGLDRIASFSQTRKNRLLLTSAERENTGWILFCSAGVHPIYILPQKDRNRRKNIGNESQLRRCLEIHPARRP